MGETIVGDIEVDLTQKEIEYARRFLGREPNNLEWAMIDAEWSEHCSYKSSRPILKQFRTKGRSILLGPGFDAGVLDVGDGCLITLHIESHNHPSAIDPYGGAATGIGGVIRDILCMGTRPIALLDSLRFGLIDKSPHSRWLFKHVVRGIADYGNCTGIPTVAGEVEFDESFEKNCLVDVVCVGVGRKEDIVLAKTSKKGDSVYLVGGSTGRDGIHGVTFASKVLTEKSEADRPAVQIPDPFTKKLIIEATLEAISTGHVSGLKDLGGGGLTCGISEMSDKGDGGIEIELSRVHLRESDMTPIEIMISESQERMVFIVEEGQEKLISAIFEKFEIPYTKIGRVTEDKNVTVRKDKRKIACLPAHFLANAPIIRRKQKKRVEKRERLKPKTPKDLSNVIISVLSSPNVASKEWVYRQYDHEVGVRTVIKPGQADAAVLRLPNGRFIAAKVDGNSKFVDLDPYSGGASCLAEACRNTVAVGALPMAMLDHCQFGDPNNKEVFWDFANAVRGIADFAKTMGLPCVGGKVSFYNEDRETGVAIKPSPVIVVVGSIEKAEHLTTTSFKSEGDSIVIAGRTKRELGGSEYYRIFGGYNCYPPTLDFAVEKTTMKAVNRCIRGLYVKSCHDCSTGGLAAALAEMCVAGDVGAEIELENAPSQRMALDELLFSESNSRFILATREKNRVLEILSKYGISAVAVGRVGGDSLQLKFGEKRVSVRLDNMKKAYLGSIQRLME